MPSPGSGSQKGRSQFTSRIRRAGQSSRPLYEGAGLGDRTPFPSPSSQSQPFWGAWQKQPGAPRSSTHKLPRFGIIPVLLFFMCRS